MGPIDVLLEPKGFERGYADLVVASVAVDIAGTAVRVGSLADLITSKRLLDRQKDREHLPLLIARAAELRRSQGPLQPGQAEPGDRRPDRGPGLGL